MSAELGAMRLQQVIEALGAVEEVRFERFLQAIRGGPEPVRAKPAKATQRLLPSPAVEIAELPARLNEAPSRDAAYALLKQLKKKDDLMALARLIGQAPKGNRAELESRIVNATAGIRLDSAAIHNRP